MAKIETLTPVQWQQMRDYREQQRAAALRTDSIDQEAAKKAINGLYVAAGLKEPQYVFFFQSPMQCLMARGLLRIGGKDQLWDQLGGQLRDQLRDQLGGQLRDQLRGQLRDQLRGQLWDQLWDQLGDQLRDQLRGQLRDQLRGQLGDQLRDQLRGQLWDQLGDQLGGQLGDQLGGQLRDQLWGQLWGQLGDQLGGQLWDQLRGQLRGQLWDQLRDQLWDQLWDQLKNNESWQALWFTGGWDNFWLAFYDFGRQIGVKYSAKVEAQFDAYRTYADTCGVSFLYPNVALVSDRPARVSFDHLRRLHADDGAALLYRDGYAVYAWRGRRVQADVIEKRHERTANEIRGEKNAEMRRVLTEIYAHLHGPDRIIKDLGAKLLAEDAAQDRPRKLYEVDGARFIHVINGSLELDGTRREFFLGAQPDSKNPHDAIAASYGRPASKYREAVRT